MPINVYYNKSSFTTLYFIFKCFNSSLFSFLFISHKLTITFPAIWNFYHQFHKLLGQKSFYPQVHYWYFWLDIIDQFSFLKFSIFKFKDFKMKWFSLYFCLSLFLGIFLFYLSFYKKKTYCWFFFNTKSIIFNLYYKSLLLNSQSASNPLSPTLSSTFVLEYEAIIL